MTHRVVTGLAAAAAAAGLLASAPAPALTCKAMARRSDGMVFVSTSGIQGGTRLWGAEAGFELQAFANEVECLDAAAGVARKCTLGPSASAESITPPPGCFVYLSDGVATCAAYVLGCVPGLRGLGADAVTAEQIAVAAVGSPEIAAGAVTAEKIAAGSVTAACSATGVVVVDATGETGVASSNTIGADGFGLIAYFGSNPHDSTLKVAHCGNALCAPALRLGGGAQGGIP